MADDFRKGLRLILVINVPAAVGLILLSHPIVNVIYRHGNFTPADADALGLLVALFAVGMPFFSVVNLTVRAFYSVKDTATPVKVAAIDFVVNLILSLILMRWLGVAGLVVSTTTAIVVQTILLQMALAKKLPRMNFRPLWASLRKVALATALMGIVVGFGWHCVQQITSVRLSAGLIAIFTLIPLGIAVYAGALWMLKFEGTEDLIAVFKRRISRPN
jgi:putative peptidoglycan lipid II flippase